MNFPSEAESILRQLESLIEPPAVPEPEAFLSLTKAAIAALEGEAEASRPRTSEGRPGGLVQIDSLLTLIVPDLHARAGLLLGILRSRLEQAPDASVLELLLQRRLSLLCLGDILHSEGDAAARRWSMAAQRRFADPGMGGILNPFMEEEMGLSLSALALVMSLTVLLGSGFHCLKGNHDNITNSAEDGDLPFYKYAQEGPMGAEWFELRYGKEGAGLLRRYELLLPLAARGRGFCASHAEPAIPLGYGDVLEGRKNPGIVRALIWTGNEEALPLAVEESLAALLPFSPRPASLRWISGHRPVAGSYALRARGRLIQIHNPERSQAALLKEQDDVLAGLSIIEPDRTSGILRQSAIVPPREQ
ncbi:MAG: hypothetical protein RBT73_08730 [Spirochaetia bacterium]|nr:hypothetical protein [Spirochaetia bacterium]